MNNCISAKRKKNGRECFHRSRTTILLLPMVAVAFTLFTRAHAHTRGDTLLQSREQRSGRNANNNLAFVNNVVDVDHDYIENEDSSILDNHEFRQRDRKLSKKQRGGFRLGVTVNTKASKKSNKSSSKSKSTKSASSGKKSGKKSKSDNVFHPHPTLKPAGRGPPSTPSSGDTPTMHPVQSPQPTLPLPTSGFTLPPGPVPTPPPLGFPTQPTLPPVSRPGPSPTPQPTVPLPPIVRQPTPTPGREPPTLAPVTPTGPTEPPAPKCSVGSDGLFGSQLGLAEETVYYYETIVTPTVTADELNLDILGRVENLMAGLILERLFARCAPEVNVRSYFLKSNLRRILQNAETIEGWSLRPLDAVLDGGKSDMLVLF
jgi:hypothetical protein